MWILMQAQLMSLSRQCLSMSRHFNLFVCLEALCGFVVTLLSCFQCLPFVKFVVTKFMNVAT